MSSSSCVVWCGVVWCVVWCGVVWCSVERRIACQPKLLPTRLYGPALGIKKGNANARLLCRSFTSGRVVLHHFRDSFGLLMCLSLVWWRSCSSYLFCCVYRLWMCSKVGMLALCIEYIVNVVTSHTFRMSMIIPVWMTSKTSV